MSHRKASISIPPPELNPLHKGLIDERKDWTKVRCEDLVRGQKPIVIPATCSVEEAATILIDNNITSAPVYDTQTKSFTGMFDFRDVVAFLLIVLKSKDFVHSGKKQFLEEWNMIDLLKRALTTPENITVKMAVGMWYT